MISGMRLWHQDLIPFLPRAQLLGQHREICALRGLGWGRRHSVVDYVFEHPYRSLFKFHVLVMDEMSGREYRVDSVWRDPLYRGRRLGYDCSDFTGRDTDGRPSGKIYAEHDEAYLRECLSNLESKGISIRLG